MSRYLINLSFILSFAFLAACSGGNSDNGASPDDQAGLDSPVVEQPGVEQPGFEQPGDAGGDTDSGTGEPDGSDSEPNTPEPASPDPDNDAGAPVQPTEPEEPEQPVSNGDELAYSEAWAIYSQTGIWRSQISYLVDMPLSGVVDGAASDQRYGVSAEEIEVYSIARSDSGEVTRTECIWREVERLEPGTGDPAALWSTSEEDEDDDNTGCSAPKLSFFKLSEDSMRIVSECENGTVIDGVVERIASDTAFSHGSLAFSAEGTAGGVFEEDVCGRTNDTHNYWGQSSNPEALTSLISNTRTWEIRTNVPYQEGFLDAAVRIKADLDRVDGLEIGKEYPVALDVAADTPVIGSAQWFYTPENIENTWIFVATSGSVTLLERNEYAAKVKFNLSDRDGKSVIGEMTINLQ